MIKIVLCNLVSIFPYICPCELPEHFWTAALVLVEALHLLSDIFRDARKVLRN
jgi:hypothetical protein